MQVVLSQRLAVPYAAAPLDLYRALRTLNPSPYMYFMDLGGLPYRRLLARDSGAARRRAGHGTPDRRHAPAREDGGGRQGTGAGAACRSQGTCRAYYADGPRAQRRWARGQDRQRARDRQDGDRTLLTRDAHRLERHRRAEAGHGRRGCAARDLSGWHCFRRAQGAGDGNHRGTRTHAPRHLFREPWATSAGTAIWTPPSPSARR